MKIAEQNELDMKKFLSVLNEKGCKLISVIGMTSDGDVTTLVPGNVNIDMVKDLFETISKERLGECIKHED